MEEQGTAIHLKPFSSLTDEMELNCELGSACREAPAMNADCFG
jgi:hypothetical protein